MNERRILLTGATGALGRALLPELIDLGFTVHCLIRPKSGLSARQRLAAQTSDPKAIAVEGDITAPFLGLDPDRLPKIEKLVHAAADIGLAQGLDDRVQEVNRGGTANALALASALGTIDFYYVGTAYVAGDAERLEEHEAEGPFETGAARNPYEKSKYDAEHEVRGYKGNFAVLRPSIVVGRSDDGTAPLLDGWYGFFRSITKLRQTFAKGTYLDELGRRITRGHPIELPINIKDMDSIRLNLIQLDWLSRTEAAIIARPANGRTYNLTHPHPIPMRELLQETLEAMEINVTLVEDHGGWTLSPLKLAVRRLINRELEHLQPYLKHSPEFVSKNLYEDLGPNWPEPPAISVEFIRKTMQAAEQDWMAGTAKTAAG